MQIEIWERTQIDTIPISDWDQLALHAIHKNPFYEAWNLIPALKWLEPRANIKIITLRNQGQLIGLFPIKISGKIPYLRALTFWKHNHCFLTTPLIEKNFFLSHKQTQEHLWGTILLELQQRFKSLAIHANTHTSSLTFKGIHSFTRYFSRPSVKIPKSWDIYESDLPSKRRKEYRRICKRLGELGELEFHSDIYQQLSPIMQEFMLLEASGWKGDCGDALAKRPKEKAYYLEVIANAEQAQKVAFNLLQLNGENVAISFGYCCDKEFFEIKTAYSETYKSSYPGIVLELKNLANYSHHPYQEVDSCTNPDNFVISRMWPDKKPLCSSWGFRYFVMQQLFRRLYPRLRKLMKNQPRNSILNLNYHRKPRCQTHTKN